MTAQVTSQEAQTKSTYHIYNEAIDGLELFADQQDFDTFINFLQEYLTPPAKGEELKKSFSVNGKQYRGVPHQPKNYSDSVTLIAFALSPKNFHLVLASTPDDISALLRSLSTRYAMYFNKKNSRKGTIFSGSYKQVALESQLDLLLLAKTLFNTSAKSSYKLESDNTTEQWVDTNQLLSAYAAQKQVALSTTQSFDDFVGNFKLTGEQQACLEGLILEDKDLAGLHQTSKHVETTQTSTAPMQKEPVSSILAPQHITDLPTPKPKDLAYLTKIQHGLTVVAVFAVLVYSGLQNISANGTYNVNAQSTVTASLNDHENTETQDMSQTEAIPVGLSQESTPDQVEVLGATNKTSEIVPTSLYLVVKTGQVVESIQIYQKPTSTSKVLGQALDGQILEYVSHVDDWYGVILTNSKTGFVSERYVTKYLQP